ncbi:MAG: DUF3396 domain-containing protein [Herbaspirillum huttiense]|uniref:type VI immunity family protein n=1 Tax=Herbaspirillum huttiense TaxID=863372 RepID=UPI001AD01764|nr:type VI immunity family protein [Herbaspirillum huttiense]MBN9359035.1 DUF3396 domain-containing protein [Herbaspirillum huttiense]
MDINQTIAKLVQSEGGICVFDKIAFPLPYNTDAVACKFGLGAELFMLPADQPLLLHRALEFLVDYWKTFPDKVNRFLADETTRTVKFSGDPRVRIQTDMDRQPQYGYSAALMGMVDIGMKIDNVNPYRSDVLVRRAEENDLSFVNAHFQICNDQGEPNFEVLLAATLRWCAICQPLHGSAGFVFIFENDQESEYTQQLFKRFPGFDFQDTGSFSFEARDVRNRIKCVNWLTVLCDALVEELGGRDKMHTTLEPVCKAHDYPGGVVIQAGAFPQIGDTWRDEVPEAYRLVARYTKSIRFETYRSGLFRVPQGLDKKEETLAWIRRFD